MASGEQIAFNRAAVGRPISSLRVRAGQSAGEQNAFRRAAVGLPVATLTAASLGATTYASDTFDRANSTTSLGTADVGGAWTAQEGTWGISSNKAYLAAPSGRQNATLAVGQSNVTVSCDITLSSTSNRAIAGLCARWADGDNYIRCYLDIIAGINGIYLQQEVANSGSSLGTYDPAGLVNGNTYNLKLVISGSTITVFLDGVERIAAVGFNAGLTSTNYGLSMLEGPAWDDGGSRWNNFLVTS